MRSDRYYQNNRSCICRKTHSVQLIISALHLVLRTVVCCNGVDISQFFMREMEGCKYFKISNTSFPTQKHTFKSNNLWSTIYFIPSVSSTVPWTVGWLALPSVTVVSQALLKNWDSTKGLYSCFPAIKMGFHSFILQHYEFSKLGKSHKKFQ